MGIYIVKELNEIEELIVNKDTKSLIKFLSNLEQNQHVYKYLKMNISEVINLNNIDIFKTLQKYHPYFMDDSMHILIKKSLKASEGNEVFNYIINLPTSTKVLKNHKFIGDILRDKEFNMIIPLLSFMHKNTQLFQQNIRMVLSSIPFANDSSSELVSEIFTKWNSEIKLKQKKEFFENCLITNQSHAQLLIDNKYLNKEEIEQHINYVMTSSYLRKSQLEFLDKNNINLVAFGYRLFSLIINEKNRESIDYLIDYMMKKDAVHIENTYNLLQEMRKNDKSSFMIDLANDYEKIKLKTSLDKTLDNSEKRRTFKI